MISYTRREYIFLILIFILIIGFFLSIYAKEQDIKDYKKAYKDIKDELTQCNNGFTDYWNGTGTIRISSNSSQFLK